MHDLLVIIVIILWTNIVYMHNDSFLKDVTDTVDELILVNIESESESDVSIVQNYCAVNKVKELLVFQLFSFEKLIHW